MANPEQKQVARAQPEQLTLNVGLRDEATFTTFLADSKLQPLLIALQNQQERLVYLYGASGTGRSHLLQAACHQEPGSLYFPLAELHHFSPQQVLEQVEQAALVCLDDIDCIAGHPAWEEAFFHLINRCLLSETRLVFSAQVAPRQLSVNLKDLRSRLSGAVVFALPVLSDEQLRELLQLRVHLRGMKINARAVDYIFRRTQRSTNALIQVVDVLDELSLVRGRELTREFVQEVLKW